MKASLLNGVPENEHNEIKADFVQAYRFRQNLVRVLQKEIDSLVVSMCDETLFGNEWALHQAEKIAEIRAKRRFIDLLE